MQMIGLVLGACLLVSGTLAAGWSHHGENGPSHWYEVNALCGADSERQSPIDVPSTQTLFEDDLTTLQLQDHYSKYRDFTVLNNGHAVKIEIDHDVLVLGGALPSKGYTLAQIHFHWGSNDNQGSEHTVDNRMFPLEMHMVTYDRERYETLGDAVFGQNSLAVLGTMFTISEEDNPALKPLIDAMDEVTEANTKTTIKSFPLANLLPTQTDKYFRYLGSLTTPPCAESVIWSLFLHTQTISSSQLAKFRTLLEVPAEDGSVSPIQDNWRPVQAINKRVIYRSFIFKSEMSQSEYAPASHDADHSAAATHTLSFMALTTLIVSRLL